MAAFVGFPTLAAVANLPAVERADPSVCQT